VVERDSVGGFEASLNRGMFRNGRALTSASGVLSRLISHFNDKLVLVKVSSNSLTRFPHL
jgi:hypothetical protein